jgi:hypothetical protein
MHNYLRHLSTLAIVLILWLSGCVHRPATDQFKNCTTGSQCNLEGRLNLRPGAPAWAALLEAKDDCAKLALPDEFYVDAKKWDGKIVEVSGRAFAQPNSSTENGVLYWYTEKDRKLAIGMCDGGIGVYVESMRTSSGGQLWPAPVN